MASSASSGNGRRQLIQSTWTKVALVVALVEAVLVGVGVVPRWVSVAIAVAVIAGWFLRGRELRPPSVRASAWAVAVSQALVLFVPLVLWILSAAVVVAVTVVAAIVLVLLVRDR
jgi:hypothetical protein